MMIVVVCYRMRTSVYMILEDGQVATLRPIRLALRELKRDDECARNGHQKVDYRNNLLIQFIGHDS